MGLANGALLGLSAVSYRGAALALGGDNVLLAAAATGCGGGMNRPALPTGEIEADRVLFERGTTALEERDCSSEP